MLKKAFFCVLGKKSLKPVAISHASKVLRRMACASKTPHAHLGGYIVSSFEGLKPPETLPSP